MLQTEQPHTNWTLRGLAALVCVLGWIAVAGCSSDHPTIAKVHGTVTLNGNPLPQGRVSLEPIAQPGQPNPGKAAFGIIQSDGTYRLGTYSDTDGAVVGKHRVTLYGTTPGNEPAKKPPFDVLRLVGQSYEVVAGQDNEINIELTSEIVRQFGERDD